MTAQVIIGANWGDEGKGMAVDALAAVTDRPLVVRFNGGAQAGHTVQLPDGRRHIFSHFGAGTLLDAPTFLSEFFVVNPEMFCRERIELISKFDINPTVWVDVNCPVTIPYDVMLNRWAEEDRTQRHGSCGVGINETVERYTQAWGFPVATLWQPDALLVDYLTGTRDSYYRDRAERLNIKMTPSREKWFTSKKAIDGWVECAKRFRSAVDLRVLSDVTLGRNVIFEGAQGLLLDQKYGMVFPHLTRSNTGLENVVKLAHAAKMNHFHVTYMTRPYFTRHGAGPLPGEVAELTDFKVVDETNIRGEWQGNLRFAPLDYNILRSTINGDLERAKTTLPRFPNITATLGISCCDQSTKLSKKFLPQHIAEEVGMELGLVGCGPTRITTQLYKRKLNQWT